MGWWKEQKSSINLFFNEFVVYWVLGFQFIRFIVHHVTLIWCTSRSAMLPRMDYFLFSSLLRFSQLMVCCALGCWTWTMHSFWKVHSLLDKGIVYWVRILEVSTAYSVSERNKIRVLRRVLLPLLRNYAFEFEDLRIVSWLCEIRATDCRFCPTVSGWNILLSSAFLSLLPSIYLCPVMNFNIRVILFSVVDLGSKHLSRWETARKPAEAPVSWWWFENLASVSKLGLWPNKLA